MPTALALRHVAFEDLGSFAPLLAARGFTIRYAEVPLGQLDADAAANAELLVVLGGPIGACEEESYPFLGAEIAVLAARLRAERPVLGICLGAQLMARALGAAVAPGPAKEIGWAPLALTEAGRASCLRHLDGAPVLHWHGDRFELPAGATRLAATPLCPNQAFASGVRALALQFHPEATAAGLEAWFVGHAAEIAATPGVSAAGLRADSARFAPELARRAEHLLADWLAGAGF